MENSLLNSPFIIPKYGFDHFISGQLISLIYPIHRIPGQFVNKPGKRLFCDRVHLELHCTDIKFLYQLINITGGIYLKKWKYKTI